MSEPEENGRARARVIARAFARTAIHHQRTALLAGLIALGGCALAVVAGRPVAKGVALLIAVAFAVAAYRALRLAQRYLHPDGSPVLQAIAQRPADIARITHESARDLVVIQHANGEVLAVRAGKSEGLVEALAEHAPHAEVAVKE